ncbi:DUF4376 domain-containing protein [Rhizobium sp. WL3]|uniref:DUF4376 domain-containing protein n=1 Tax=Rhizobium sp. WL3 TaxID=2603277 RepID=UPI0011C1E813|nr:DUF4376 domain-containing protein [Rhizobium sp. WL3]QEE47492.1 DUF4376 domain-containing protein [Rhizobium sp. WL3]
MGTRIVVNVNGSEAPYVEVWDPTQEPGYAPYIPSVSEVNAERNRRIHAGFLFNGKIYAFDPSSKQRVTGAGTLAGFAIASGAQPGNTIWHGGQQPFRWIADDNSLTEMDAQTCFAFAQAAAAHEEAHIFAARAIKDMSPIPADYASNGYWPTG